MILDAMIDKSKKNDNLYENMIAELKSVNPIDETYMSSNEFMIALAYQCEQNIHNIDIAIMGDEYIALKESGYEIVMENGKIKGIIDKAKQAILWVWKQIQRFFKTVIQKIKDSRLGQFVKNHRNKQSGDEDNPIIRSNFIFPCDEYIVTDVGDNIPKLKVESTIFDEMKDGTEILDRMLNVVKQTLDRISQTIKTSQYGTNNTSDDIGENISVDSFLHTTAIDILGNYYYGNNKDISVNFSKGLKDYFGVEAVKKGKTVYYKIPKDCAYNFLSRTTDILSTISNLYAKNKSFLNKAIDDLDEFTYGVSIDSPKYSKMPIDQKKLYMNAKLHIDYCKSVLQWLFEIDRVAIHNVNSYISFAKKVIAVGSSSDKEDAD